MNAFQTHQANAEATAKFFIDAWQRDDYGEYVSPFQKSVATIFGQTNPTTGRFYQAGNQLYLSVKALERGVADDRWMTMKQANDGGYKIRKGAKSERVTFYTKIEPTNDEEEGRSVLRFYNVFNGADIIGIPENQKLKLPEAKWTHDECERLIERSQVPIRHVEGSRAYYHPGLDEVVVPLKEQFRSMEHYYATVLHELGHSTGHSSRLNRPFAKAFGTPEYAREELVAEISSMMMCQRLGLKHELGQHISYVKSWCQLLEEKPTEIFKAATEAERVCEHLNVVAPQLEPLPKQERTHEERVRIEKGREHLNTRLDQQLKRTQEVVQTQ